MAYISVTDSAQELIAQSLKPGQLAIDATIGNGHDTLFMAELVGAEGQVFGFDIQQQALANTRQRLADAGLENRVTLIQGGHENMEDLLPCRIHGQISVIMFNLGYLPGGDKNIITRPGTTRAAVEIATRLLAPGGIMTILVYRGHPGGQDEADTVSNALDSMRRKGFEIELQLSPGPWFYVVKKSPRT